MPLNNQLEQENNSLSSFESLNDFELVTRK